MKKLTYLIERIKNLHYDKMIETAKKVHKINHKPTFFILIDMAYCGFKYLAGYSDYYEFKFYDLNKEERGTYVTRGENNKIVSALNDKAYWYIFQDKIIFNEYFSEFLHREWLDLRKCSFEEFKTFASSREKFVAKPIDGICGEGIEIIHINAETDFEELFKKLKDSNLNLIDSFVTQHSELARIYPKSLNTVRMVTILKNGKAIPVFAGLRMGNGKFVDNLSGGGVAATIDINTGIIDNKAFDFYGNEYSCHPMTKEPIEGFQIPHFDMALEIVKKAALVVPQVGYIGWDVAISEDDVCLIEANEYPGNSIYYPPAGSKIGLLPRFKAALED